LKCNGSHHWRLKKVGREVVLLPTKKRVVDGGFGRGVQLKDVRQWGVPGKGERGVDVE